MGNALVFGVLVGTGVWLWAKNKAIDNDKVPVAPDYLPSNKDPFGFGNGQEGGEGKNLPELDGGDKLPSGSGSGEGSNVKVSLDINSFSDLINLLKDYVSRGCSIQGFLNLGNSNYAEEMLERLRRLYALIEEGANNNWEGWGADEFNNANDVLRYMGVDFIVSKKTKPSDLASIETFLTEVTILVEAAKSNPATIYSAPKITFDAYEASVTDWDTNTMAVSVSPLTPKWDNMMLFCPRHRINTTVTMMQLSNGSRRSGLLTTAGTNEQATFTDPSAFLNFMRNAAFNPNQKLALDSERGAIAFNELGYDLNIMVPRHFSLLQTNFQTTAGWGVHHIQYWYRLEKQDNAISVKLSCFKPKGIELRFNEPTIGKLKRYLGIGNIGNYDLFVLEGHSEPSGIEGLNLNHFKATARSSDLTATDHPWLFDELEDEMRVTIYPQTYFEKGTGASSVTGRFFFVPFNGYVCFSGLRANQIQFIGELQSGMITPTLKYTVLETSRGIVIKVTESTATESPLRSGESLVLITKESVTLSARIIEDERCLVVGQKKTINFQQSD